MIVKAKNIRIILQNKFLPLEELYRQSRAAESDDWRSDNAIYALYTYCRQFLEFTSP